jgi:hypothetical protein
VKNLGPAEVVTEEVNGKIIRKIIKANSSLSSAVVQEKDAINLPIQKIVSSDAINPLVIRQQSGIFTPVSGSNEPVRFVPQFVLATNRLVLGTIPVEAPETETTVMSEETTEVAYNDRIIPLALPIIMRREGFGKLPETTVSIAQKVIAPGEELWGVAMWMDIDPRIHDFSIYITGLTNAYQWENKVKEIDPETDKIISYENDGTLGEGRILKRRVLKTDWWRVGDSNSLDESQIHFGSREGKMPVSPFDQTGRLTAEERQKLVEHTQNADKDKDGRVSPLEKVLYHLRNQDWLKPSFGYEWIFL